MRIPLAIRLALGFFLAALFAATATWHTGVEHAKMLRKQSNFYQALLQTNTTLTNGSQLLKSIASQSAKTRTDAITDPKCLAVDEPGLRALMARYDRMLLTYASRDLLSQHPDQSTLLGKEAAIGAAKLWYDKPKKQFYLLVSLEIEVADPTPQTHKGIVGVDVGVRYLAVTSTTEGMCSFFTGKSVGALANHYARLRKRLQKKGTRSATRRLVAISSRERRLKQDANHKVSKRIATLMWTRGFNVRISQIDVDTFPRGTLNNTQQNVST